MTDYSPTSMEDVIQNLVNQSSLLRIEVPGLLSQKDDEILDKSRQDREEFRSDIQTVADSLKDKIGEMESILRKLRQIKQEQGIDCEKLNTRAFGIRRERKTYNA